MKLSAWIKLIRPVNLIILALTQYFVDLFVLQPNFNKYGILFTLNEFQFFLLVLSTVLICGAGYIINDYFDVKADALNKPSRQIVGKIITQQTAYRWYTILTCAGLAIGIYLSIAAGNWKLVTFHLTAVFLLYSYSASFKKVALLGNVIVSILIAISILIVGAFEPHLYNLAREGDYYAADLCWKIIFGVSVFAFLLTMVREIVKDVEDISGDRQTGAHTIPVVWGVSAAKGIALFFLFIAIALLYYCYKEFSTDETKNYLWFAIVLGAVLLFTAVKLILAKQKEHFSQLSMYIKVSMLAGLCFLPLYYLTEF